MRLRHFMLAAAFTIGFAGVASASPPGAAGADVVLSRDLSVAYAKWKDKGWKGGHPGRHLGWQGRHPGRHLGWERGRHRGWAKKARHRGAYWR